MYLVYTALALAEFFIFIASAIGLLILITRGAIALFRKSEPAQTPPKPEELHHLKRADARQSG